MTRVIEIAGIRPEVSKNELADRAKNVKPTAFVDTANLSEGEMTVFLLAQRAKIRSEFYPEYRQYRDEYERARDVLYKGLHTLGVDYLGQRLKSQPASGWLTWNEKQRNPSAGIKLLFDDAPEIGAIPQLDCNALYPLTPPNGMPINLTSSWIADQTARRLACQTENKWRESLNKYWEKGSFTLVYRAITSDTYFIGVDPLVSALVADKRSNHRYVFSKIQEASKISTTNLNLWWENGNLVNSIAYGLGPQLGIEFVDGLRANADVHINGFVAALAGLAIDVLKNTYNQFKLLAGVIKGDLTLKAALQQHVENVEQFFKTHSDDIQNLASNKDWREPGDDMPPIPQGGGNGSGGNFWDNLTQTEKIGLGIAVVGGAMLLNRK